MPQRSLVSQLPPDVKAELDRRLIESDFSGYEQLEAWLEENGFQISKSSIHRYGSKFEENLAALKIATEQARAIAEAAPDDEGIVNDALMRLAQQKAFEVLRDMNVSPDSIDFTKLLRGVSDLGKASVAQKKWMTEMRSKLEEKFKTLEQDTRQGKRTLDPETLRIIREEVYGIV